MNHVSSTLVFSFLLACGAPSPTPSTADSFRPSVEALQAWAQGEGAPAAFVDASGVGRLRFVHDDTDPAADEEGNVREGDRLCGASAESAIIELRGALAQAFSSWNEDMAEEAGRADAVECNPSEAGVLCHYAGYSQGDNALFLRFERRESEGARRWVLNTSTEMETNAMTTEFHESADAWLEAREHRVSAERCARL